MNIKKYQTQKFNGRPVALAVILTGLIAFVLSSSFTGSDGLVNLDSMMPNQTVMVDESANPDNNLLTNSDGKKATKITTEEGLTYTVYFKDGPDGKEISEVWLDGKEVPASKWKGNENFFVSKGNQPQEKPGGNEIDELKANLKGLYTETNQLKDELTAYKKELSASGEEMSQMQKDYIKKMYYSLSETEKKLALLNIKLNDQDRKLTEEQMAKVRKMMYEQQEDLQRANVKMKTLLGEDQDLTEAELMEIKAEQAEMKERMKNWYPVLTKELIEDGIIKEGESAIVVLSIEEMIVVLSDEENVANEIKQPKKTHQKYLELYTKMRGKPIEGYTPISFVINGKPPK